MSKIKIVKPRCAVLGCGVEGLIKVESGNWLCHEHLVERLNQPDIRAFNEALSELDEFLDDGGKPS